MSPCYFPRPSFHKRRAVLKLCAAGFATSLTALSITQEAGARQLDVPYEPSPQPVVDGMLAMAGLNGNDIVYDLGCGDGRIVITAAAKYGARGVGIDIDPRRIAEAKANARRAGVEHKVKFAVENLFTADFSEATVVTLFLWPHVNRKLRPELWRQLRPGTRVVSHLWDMGEEWPPDKTEVILGRKIHYWTIKDTHKRTTGS